MKQLLIAFTFLLVFTVSLTPAALGADYPPSPSKSEDTNPSKNPIDEIKKNTKDENYYGKGGYNQRTPYENYNGGFDGTAEAESIKMWFCGNNPFGSVAQTDGAYNYAFDGRQSFNSTSPGLLDQNELRNSVIQKCMKSEKYIDWHTTDTVYVVIFAPGFNEDPFKADYIGNKQYNEIFCTSDASPTVGMWQNEGGREGAKFGYQSWVADNGLHAELYAPFKIGGALSTELGGTSFMADRSLWDGDYYPGYMAWWSNQGDKGLASVKGIKEIGNDSGVFGGTVTLSGIKRFIALPEKMSYGVSSGGPYNKQFTSGSERSSEDLIGTKICNVQTDRTGGFTIAWEYSEDKFVSKTAYYTMKEADVKFGHDVYTMDEQVSVILADRDVSSRPWDSTPIEVRVWSDSDQGGIKLELRHERDWWVFQADDQTFYGNLFLTSTEESKDYDNSGKAGITCYEGECYERGSGQLHAQPGDHIYVEYSDYTLPKPFGVTGCTMSSSDWTVDSEPDACPHIEVSNFAKVKDSTPLSEVSLKKVNIQSSSERKIIEMNGIYDEIDTQKRLLDIEIAKVRDMGYEPTSENMNKYSFKYDNLINRITDLTGEINHVKNYLELEAVKENSKTFVEGQTIYISGTFVSNTYSPNQFIFAVQAENLDTGLTDYVGLTDRHNITKKKSVDVELQWTPQSPGNYVLKLYPLDGGNMGAVSKNPIINHIQVESVNSELASGPDTSKN